MHDTPHSSASHDFSYQKYLSSDDGSLLKKVYDFNRQREDHRTLFDTMYARVLCEACGSQVYINDPISGSRKMMRMFGSNNYLGLTTHPQVKAAMIKAIERYGAGSGGVPLLSGTLDIQCELEAAIARMKGTEAAMVFTSGYVANLGAVSGLVRPYNFVVHDKLNHASIIDGSILSGAKFTRFKHNNPESLGEALSSAQGKFAKGILVAVDGVYSMDGDIAALDLLLPVVQEYSAVLLVDDAHATGVIGQHGAGTLSHFRISDRDILITGTLSKAVGTVGGFVAGNREVIEYLRIYARSNMFSTSLPPGICGAAIEAVRIILESDLVSTLGKLCEQIRSGLTGMGYDTGASKTAVIPVMIRDEDILLKMSMDLHREGIFVNAIKSPVVLPSRSRFRISVMATHTQQDIEHLLSTFQQIGKRHHII